GQLAIIPWDYNLALGGMSGSDANSTINGSIDSPVTSGSVSDRPLISWIFSDAEAKQTYHDVYREFIESYVESGWLEDGTQPLTAEIQRVADMIRPYVEADANSFYSVAAFDTAIDNLLQYCALRSESIQRQLNGDNTRVDASSVSIAAMGSMNGGGGGFGGGRSSRDDASSDARQTNDDGGDAGQADWQPGSHPDWLSVLWV
ncbi:MAG: CotH kinase family protein, partial [Erysipelotrichaceae bacterium]|nr:CotH kinase family protein [Erysipelotrichaceae bacterium]